MINLVLRISQAEVIEIEFVYCRISFLHAGLSRLTGLKWRVPLVALGASTFLSWPTPSFCMAPGSFEEKYMIST